MDWRVFSVVFMIVAFLVIIGVDIFLLTRKQDATFSERIRAGARKWQPLIILMCFGMGLLSGHFFWTHCGAKDKAVICGE